MAIHILDPITITQISAGEVIDRPSSVVKELIENALDAGATRIQITLDNGGKTRIQITDNGHGIAQEDLPKAPLPHATSKIRTLNDLETLSSFGFRGEALASIAHVATLTITSRHQDSPLAYQLDAHLDHISELTPTAHPVGTTLTVCQLFEGLPVRQKFLKSTTTEAGYCYDVVLHQLLVRPDVDFILIHDGKTLLNSAGLKSTEDCLYTILGASLKNQLVPLHVTHNGLTVTGVIGKPSLTYSNRAKQWLAINGRPIKGGILSKTIQQAYEKLVPHGRYPLAILDLTLEGVDVNIHPQKHEVKFLHPGRIFESLLAILKSTFAQASHPLSPPFPSSPSSSPSSPFSLGPSSQGWQPQTDGVVPQSLTLFSPNYNHKLEYFQIFDTYIVIKSSSGVTLLDQHAVHERVLYEKLKTQLHTPHTQPLMSAETVHLPADLMGIFAQVHSQLIELGFMIEEFGPDTLVIREIPLAWERVSLTPFLIGLLSDLRHDGVTQIDLESERRAQLQIRSCKAAIKAGNPLSPLEVHALIHEFLAIPDRDTCPHGRPVSITFDRSKLERLFLRS